MSTAATATPTLKVNLSTIQLRSLKTLPENWRELALASKSTGVRAIASAFAMLLDGEGGIAPIGKDGKANSSATIADRKYNAGYHSRERAQYIVSNSPATVRDIFLGHNNDGLEKIHRELKVKMETGKHEEPLNVERVKGTATMFELKYELYEMLNNADLEKVTKYALARLHPDNKETGNEGKFQRLTELWGKIKDVEGI